MILKAENLVKSYGRRLVVNGMSLDVQSNEIVGLLGPNGAGKTTSFFMIVGAIAPNGGHIKLGEEDITEWPMYERARRGIGFLAQEPTVFRKLSVWDNIMAVLEHIEKDRAIRKFEVEHVLSELGLMALKKQRADSLSGGETRRLEIARALVQKPKFMLLDEPFSGIDPKAVEDIQEIIRQLKKRGIGVLITDHNVRETLSITDRSYILSDGQILISGTPQKLASDPEARRIYLGDRFRLD
ncbi:MAG: LPS export ABC transporter ATP-binding protein [Candidatus Latescibacteria bacterium]|jgi:lipopolysaccharide export system ATP-binding protein|nr:LPS export ABC transporter ATP-binding protein [Candidatus Latescibacterota bacterium]